MRKITKNHSTNLDLDRDPEKDLLLRLGLALLFLSSALLLLLLFLSPLLLRLLDFLSSLLDLLSRDLLLLDFSPLLRLDRERERDPLREERERDREE